MSRARCQTSAARPIPLGRGRLVMLRWLVTFSIGMIAAPALGAPVDRIGVARFANAGRVSDAAQVLVRRDHAAFVANELAAQLALRSVDRLLGPDDFVSESLFEPRAEDVRKWAYNASVDVILVGRVTSTIRPDGLEISRIEVVIRSGHSGAELSRHDVDVQSRADLRPLIDELATAISSELGHDATPLVATPAGPVASADRDATPPKSDTRSAGHGLDAKLAFAGFQSQAPIEIKADEAEIVAREDGRELVFQRNVRVRQANVTLLSDRLEASYRKGESEPRRLVAKGSVKIEQGDRRAVCDQAIYVREESRLTCRGRAELIQGCDIVRGESIEFDLAADQARVEGAASIVIRPRDDAGSPCQTRMGAL